MLIGQVFAATGALAGRVERVRACVDRSGHTVWHGRRSSKAVIVTDDPAQPA